MERRTFLKTAAAFTAPAILGADDKSGTKLPVIGSGEHTYEAITTGANCRPRSSTATRTAWCEDSQGHIYVHHTVNAASESSDSMVVFDDKGKFVKSWGKEFKGGAHGLHIRKEGSTEFLYLCDTARGVVVKATLDGEESSASAIRTERGVQARRGRQEAQVQPDEPRDRAQRRYLCRRRLRLQLHQPVQQQGRVHPHVRRQGQGGRASSIARTASLWTRAEASRS